MGNMLSDQKCFHLTDCDDLNNFLSSVNMIDGFYMDTSLSISSKCFFIFNNLIDSMNDNSIKLMTGLKIRQDENLFAKINKLKFHCSLIKHLGIVNSSVESVEELVMLNNVRELTSLTLENVPIKCVQHLKLHRKSLVRLSLNNSIDSLHSVINLCGGDHSFHDNWTQLLHLDVRYNQLKNIDDSVESLTSLTVLDISRNDINDISFVQKIPTLVCLNASFNGVRFLPHVVNTRLRVLILAYNFLESLEGINGFKFISTFNISYNMIASTDHLLQLKEMDFLKDLILRGNPFYYSEQYRKSVLNNISPHVSVNFALDGKYVTKKESAYFRKADIIFIQPQLVPPLLEIYNGAYVITVEPSEPFCANQDSLSQNNATNNSDRNMGYPNIDYLTSISTSKNRNTVFRKNVTFHPFKEKWIENIGSERSYGPSFSCNTSVAHLSKMGSNTFQDDSFTHNPSYVGSKTSNLFIANPHKIFKSFTRVSVQIFEHKFMGVDEFGAAVDNVDLWLLMVATLDTLNETSDAGNVLKLVFFESTTKDDAGTLIMSTRTIEFAEVLELKTFLHELNLYLYNFSISFHDWTLIPLTDMCLNCTNCNEKFIIRNKFPRPYCCQKCFRTSFILQSSLSKSIDNVEKELVKKSITNIPGFFRKNSTTGVTSCAPKVFKPKTSDLIKECLPNKHDDCQCLTSVDPINCADTRVVNIDELLRESAVDTNLTNTECKPLILDGIVDSNVLNVDLSVMAHDCQEENAAYALLKSALNTPWVVHEELYDISLYMHDNTKIDDRVKLYFLTKTMLDNEDLLFVFRVYFLYRSTGMAIAALLVISDLRVIIYNLLDVSSSNFEDCIKLVCEFPLISLQQLEYCLHYQWLEIHFKGKQIVTLLIGDIGCVKQIGTAITDVVSKNGSNFAVKFSKEIGKLKSTSILCSLTNGFFDGVTMETLEISESYLINSSTVLPTTEAHCLEYDPKMIIIESKHIFFVTFSYSNKSPLPSFYLSHTILIYDIMNKMIIDSKDNCLIRLIVIEKEEKRFVNIRFMSPQSRSKAVFCIAQIWKEMYGMSILFITEDLFDDY